jgi:hypothetical protein
MPHDAMTEFARIAKESFLEAPKQMFSPLLAFYRQVVANAQPDTPHDHDVVDKSLEIHPSHDPAVKSTMTMRQR